MVHAEQPDVGRRLAAARLQRGISQATVARRAGIAPSYISRLENGKIHPTFRTVMRVAQAMGMTFEEITGPAAVGTRNGACPVTRGGKCLLDLIRAEERPVEVPDEERFTPRQIRVLRKFAGWVRTAGADRVRALELVIDDLARATALSGHNGS